MEFMLVEYTCHTFIFLRRKKNCALNLSTISLLPCFVEIKKSNMKVTQAFGRRKEQQASYPKEEEED